MTPLNRSITVGDVALPLSKVVVLSPTDVFRVAVESMSRNRLGIACIVDPDGKLIGVFTDGDIRRVLLREHKPIAALFAEDILHYMTRNPKTTSSEMSLESAVLFMEMVDVYDLPVVDASGRLTGILHMHTALKFLLSL
jgi:arabinose-5-phosphate isomerase